MINGEGGIGSLTQTEFESVSFASQKCVLTMRPQVGIYQILLQGRWDGAAGRWGAVSGSGTGGQMGLGS